MTEGGGYIDNVGKCPKCGASLTFSDPPFGESGYVCNGKKQHIFDDDMKEVEN